MPALKTPTETKAAADPIAQARCDLAAALRWADRLGLGEGICNHFSLLVPGTSDQFLLNPQGLHWSEIRASDLIIVNPDGERIDDNNEAGDYEAEPTAFFIHSRVHLNKPSARCVLHTHMPYATTLCCLDGGRLEWLSQTALRFFGRVAYDDEYNGLALDAAEGDRMSQKLGDHDVLFLANHGVIVTGEDMATAFDDLYYLERACMLQVLVRGTGQPPKMIPEALCRATREHKSTVRDQAYLHLEAIKRILTRESPEFLD